MKMNRKQNGVVLLSCLVFLLLLLILLRFSLSSAKMEEMKVGADYDETNAYAAARMVLKDAEMEIMQVNNLGVSKRDSKKSITDNEADVLKLAAEYWKDLSLPQTDNPSSATTSSPLPTPNGQNGIYDGDTEHPSNQPFYQRISGWNTNTCDNTVRCYGEFTGAEVHHYVINNNNIVVKDSRVLAKNLVGKYIIERFNGNGKVLGLGVNDENRVILRVTAVGFSKPVASSTNISRVILQSVYVLTP